MKKYVKPGGKLLARFTGEDIELNWTAITRLYELAYRCTCAGAARRPAPSASTTA